MLQRPPKEEMKHVLLNDDRHGPSEQEQLDAYVTAAHRRVARIRDQNNLLSSRSILSRRNLSAKGKRPKVSSSGLKHSHSAPARIKETGQSADAWMPKLV